MIPQSFIQDLLNRVDIVDVVSRHVQLKKSGANLMGLCPFHNEKSPSFTVSPTKQFYHCFGCGAHGTAIGFLIEHGGMGFVDAVKELAQNVGLTVPNENDQLPPAQRAEQQAKTLALSEVMQRASDFYRRQLRSATDAIAYLKGRGLSGEIAAKFSMGFSPDQWDALKEMFPDYQAAALVEAGLVIDREDDDGMQRKRYDRFRGRIMFPIKNTKGQVIAFGGRVMGDGDPKYLNSPETPLFQKGNELYGLFEARQAIRDAGYVLVTEGYMDVVALAQLGFPQTVATLGTACTPMHVQKLLRQTDHLIFSFDGDAAGRRAARRALDACLPHAQDDKTIGFLFLPKEHDPDSFVRQFGADAFQKVIAEAMPLSQFLLKEVVGSNDLNSLEGRARMQFNAKPLLQMMPSSALRMQILQGLAQLARLDLADMESSLQLIKSPVSNRARAPSMKNTRTAPIGLTRQMLKLLVAHPSLARTLERKRIELLWKSMPDQKELLLDLIDQCIALGSNANFAALFHLMDEAAPSIASVMSEVASEPEADFEVSKQELEGALRQVTLQFLKKELAVLAENGLENEENRHQFRALMEQQERIRQELQAEGAKR